MGALNREEVQRAAAKAKREGLGQTFDFQLGAAGLTDGLEREFRFHPDRRWRFDFAYPVIKLAVEVEGVTGGPGGRHQRREGYAGDCEKYNAAVMLGWRVLRFTGDQVRKGEALAVLETFLQREARGDYAGAELDQVARIARQYRVALESVLVSIDYTRGGGPGWRTPIADALPPDSLLQLRELLS